MIAAIYTQRCQDRLQRVAREVEKRETVYADFVMQASNLLLNAYTRDEIVLGGDEPRLIGLINRMRLFAPQDVVGGAEAVVKAIVEISLKPTKRRRSDEACTNRLENVVTFKETLDDRQVSPDLRFEHAALRFEHADHRPSASTERHRSPELKPVKFVEQGPADDDLIAAG